MYLIVYNANQFLEFTLNCHFALYCTSAVQSSVVTALNDVVNCSYIRTERYVKETRLEMF